MGKKQNVQVVQKFYQLLQDRDIPGLMSLLTDDVELVSAGPKELLPWAGEYHGPEGVLQYYTTLSEGVELTGMELKEFIAQRDKVVLLGQHKGRVRATGGTYDLPWAQVFTVREGKVAGLHVYHDSYVVAEAARGG